jgi:hypothetical protein
MTGWSRGTVGSRVRRLQTAREFESRILCVTKKLRAWWHRRFQVCSYVIVAMTSEEAVFECTKCPQTFNLVKCSGESCE